MDNRSIAWQVGIPHVPARSSASRIRRGVGGKAFPKDFNWICPRCKGENRSFELECGYCRHESLMRGENGDGR